MECRLQRSEHRQVQAGPGLQLSVRCLLIGAYRSTTRCLVSRCRVYTTWSATTLVMLQHTPTAVCKLVTWLRLSTRQYSVKLTLRFADKHWQMLVLHCMVGMEVRRKPGIIAMCVTRVTVYR
jgi:hypothetical protein